MRDFFNKAKKEYESEEFEKSDKKQFFRRSYEKHFENYEEEIYVKKNGKTGVRRVYKGMYYQQDLSRSSYILLRVAYVLCLLLTVALYWRGATFVLGSNFAAVIVLAQSITGLLLLWTLFVLVIYLVTPKKMTKGDYLSSSRPLCKAARNAAIGMAVTLAMTLSYDLSQLPQFNRDDILCMFCFCAGSLLMLCIYIIENRVSYTTFWEDTST